MKIDLKELEKQITSSEALTTSRNTSIKTTKISCSYPSVVAIVFYYDNYGGCSTLFSLGLELNHFFSDHEVSEAVKFWESVILDIRKNSYYKQNLHENNLLIIEK